VVEGQIRYIEKEVIKYVETHADSCVLDPEWVRLANTAAAGPFSEAPAGDHEAASGSVTAAEALPTITANYGTYHRVKEQLTACQALLANLYEETNGEKLEYEWAQ
jgi:hypothetical protein